jgi:NAD-dependent DNA ligase
MYRSKTRARVSWREGSFPMNAVGESHYQDVLEKICGGHSRYGHEFEVDADLLRQPTNPHDANAVAVKIRGNIVGHLSREQAARVSSQMAEDGIDQVACRAKIVGGWRTNQYDEGFFGVRLAIPMWGWIDFGLGKKEPVRSTTKTQPDGKDKTVRPQAAEDGPLKGQYIVIWGAKDSGEEAQELAKLGAHIMAGVGKSTTMVVQINEALTPGMESSSTYRKAKERITKGANLEIISLKALRERLKEVG